MPRRAFEQADGSTTLRREGVVSPFLAASGIYRLLPMFHLMLESVAIFDETVLEQGTERETGLTLSPGFRGGWNVGDKQVIVGFALPITWVGDTQNTGAFFYFSYELPFKR